MSRPDRRVRGMIRRREDDHPPLHSKRDTKSRGRRSSEATESVSEDPRPRLDVYGIGPGDRVELTPKGVRALARVHLYWLDELEDLGRNPTDCFICGVGDGAHGLRCPNARAREVTS